MLFETGYAIDSVLQAAELAEEFAKNAGVSRCKLRRFVRFFRPIQLGLKTCRA